MALHEIRTRAVFHSELTSATYGVDVLSESSLSCSRQVSDALSIDYCCGRPLQDALAQGSKFAFVACPTVCPRKKFPALFCRNDETALLCYFLLLFSVTAGHESLTLSAPLSYETG
jgi:hypothetical protein